MRRFALTVACTGNTEVNHTINVAVQSSDL
jgi:hypothetical protein